MHACVIGCNFFSGYFQKMREAKLFMLKKILIWKKQVSEVPKKWKTNVILNLKWWKNGKITVIKKRVLAPRKLFFSSYNVKMSKKEFFSLV